MLGSHGDGDDYETQTPIVAWGAGVPKYAETTKTTEKLFSIVGSTKVPRFDVKQIDIAPLMATLLGIPVPVNSYGHLPLTYLNASEVRNQILFYIGKLRDLAIFLNFLVIHRKCNVS